MKIVADLLETFGLGETTTEVGRILTWSWTHYAPLNLTLY